MNKLNAWLLLTYKVPPEPSKHRIALWRKLKGLGAVYLQNSICLLPNTTEHIKQLKLIENDIAKMDGESVLLETVALDKTQEQKIVNRFKSDRDEEYKEFLGKCADFDAEIKKETKAKHFTYAELEENDVDLKKLETWLDKIKRLDFYGATLAATSIEKFKECQRILDDYAQKVYDAHDENH